MRWILISRLRLRAAQWSTQTGTTTMHIYRSSPHTDPRYSVSRSVYKFGDVGSGTSSGVEIWRLPDTSG